MQAFLQKWFKSLALYPSNIMLIQRIIVDFELLSRTLFKPPNNELFSYNRVEGDFMYYGKVTKELEKLYKEYEEKFGYSPHGEESLEYGDSDYKTYVSDIKKAINQNIHIAELYPDDEDDF